MIVNRADLADILGCALGTVDGYVRDGMPEEPSEGRQRRFNTAQAIKWLRERDKGSTDQTELADAELRERKARAGLRELELGERARSMVHISDLVMLMDEQFGIVKSHLSALPARLANRLAAETDPTEVRRVIREEVASMYAAMQPEPLAERLVTNI